MTKQRGNRAVKTAFFRTVDTVTLGTAERFFIDALADVYASIQAILGDGQSAQVRNVKLHFRCYSVGIFHFIPLIVQTAGTVSDTVDLTSGMLDVNLAEAIDDVFGYQKLAPMKVSKNVPGDDPTANTSLTQGIEMTTMLPGNIIAIINKEIGTERLQDLIVTASGYSLTTDPITVYLFWEVDYVEVKKSVVLR